MLDTLAGPLGITPYPTWIATRFEDVTRAREAPISGALNPYSGKWMVPGSTPARRGPGPQAAP